MEDIDMRYLFIGIESADEKVLASSGKSQNLNRQLYDDLHKIYSYGMIVNGGFIIGFDDETSETARSIADCVDYGKIGMPMIGLLYALPNTQLTRRLARENRLFKNSSLLNENDKDNIDQTTCGLNFITKRPRSEIITDLVYILEKVYERKSYFGRCLKLGMAVRAKRKYQPSFRRRLRTVHSLLKLIGKLGLRPSTCYYFWRNILFILLVRPSSAEEVANLMAMYIHFRKQTKHTIELMTHALRDNAISEVEIQNLRVDSIVG
jgi:radical SAM superfamily enzyme YgiQ (UPF0313 family)